MSIDNLVAVSKAEIALLNGTAIVERARNFAEDLRGDPRLLTNEVTIQEIGSVITNCYTDLKEPWKFYRRVKTGEHLAYRLAGICRQIGAAEVRGMVISAMTYAKDFLDQQEK